MFSLTAQGQVQTIPGESKSDVSFGTIRGGSLCSGKWDYELCSLPVDLPHYGLERAISKTVQLGICLGWMQWRSLLEGGAGGKCNGFVRNPSSGWEAGAGRSGGHGCRGLTTSRHCSALCGALGAALFFCFSFSVFNSRVSFFLSRSLYFLSF